MRAIHWVCIACLPYFFKDTWLTDDQINPITHTILAKSPNLVFIQLLLNIGLICMDVNESFVCP